MRPGVYALGSPWLSRRAELMAAVLFCGEGAVLSHESAAELWGIRPRMHAPFEVIVPGSRHPRAADIVVHRRREIAATVLDLIPVTAIVDTLVDVASRLTTGPLERAINEADRLDLIDPEELRAALDGVPPRPGKRSLRRTLDRHGFTLTDSELERLFPPLAREAGLPAPLTRQWVSGYRVDFFWPDLGLVVETDGLRYHRTPASQARDRERDQAHAARGLLTLRFTHAQVRFEPDRVIRVLASVVGRRSTGGYRAAGG